MHFKHQLLKPLKLNANLICGLWLILFGLNCVVDCKTLNDYSNFTNLNENFKYDPAATFPLATNSITSFELLKNNINSDVKPINCGCPPKGKIIANLLLFFKNLNFYHSLSLVFISF